jgi:hypothetical protein
MTPEAPRQMECIPGPAVQHWRGFNMPVLVRAFRAVVGTGIHEVVGDIAWPFKPKDCRAKTAGALLSHLFGPDVDRERIDREFRMWSSAQ